MGNHKYEMLNGGRPDRLLDLRPPIPPTFHRDKILPEGQPDFFKSLAKLSLAWVLANPLITSAIIGASRAEQLSDTLAAADFTLDDAIKTQLDEASVQYRWGDAAR